MRSFLKRHWFLLLLSLFFLIGYTQAASLQSILNWHILRDLIVFAVMWLMGFTLPAAQIKRCLLTPKPSLLAIAISICVVPLFVIPFAYLLPDAFYGGLFVTAIVPSTLASASVWTRRAGGDDSVSMMTTIVTNLGCVIVVPIGIWIALEQQVKVDPWAQVGKLSSLVVLPLILSQIMRQVGCADWADRNKSKIAVFAQYGILAMVFWGAISSAISPIEGEGKVTQGIGLFLLVIFCSVLIHCAALGLGIFSARRLGMPKEHQIAVGFAGSQKTLMVGLQIAIDCGVSVLPMILYHLSQLLIDTLVADRWREKVKTE